MTFRVSPGESPPLSVVAPFLLSAPIALTVAGIGIAMAGSESFEAVNAPHTLAIVHSLLLGWLTLAIMGASYQLGPAVFRLPLRSVRLARVQFVLHVAGLGIFVPATWNWAVHWMAIGGGMVVLSVICFLFNVARLRPWSAPVQLRYVRLAHVFLALTIVVGLTFVGNLLNGWFAITPGVLAAHAHLGLLGWIGLTVMGVSYQLVPMFNLAHTRKPRFATVVLVLTSGGLVVFGAGMITDPARPIRLLLALPLVVGFALFDFDQLRLFSARSRRKRDIQGWALPVSLAFLSVTCLAAIGAAWGSPLTGEVEAARWPIAYGLLGVVGWAGTAVLGNSHKIIPFLVWYHRYRPGIGTPGDRSPLLRDLYDERLAMSILVLHTAATLLLAASALAGWLPGLRSGGVVLALSGTLQAASFAWMVMPRTVRPNEHSNLKMKATL